MDYSVPTLSIVFMAVVAMVGIIIPVVLLLVFRKKYKAKILLSLSAALFLSYLH